MFSCAFATIPYGVLGQVWCSIVSIPDLCLLAYFYTKTYGSISTATLCNIAAVTIDRVQWEHWNSPKLGEHLVPTSDLIVPT